MELMLQGGKRMDTPTITGIYPRNSLGFQVRNDGAKVSEFLLEVDARGDIQLYIHSVLHRYELQYEASQLSDER